MKILAITYYLVFVYILFTVYYANSKGRMFERLKKKFFDIKINGRFDDMAEEEAYCGMFVSLQG